MTWRLNTHISLPENAYDVIMTSPFVQFFENVNIFSSYKGLSAHKIWFNLGQGKQSCGGGWIPTPPGWECIESLSWDRVKIA